MVATRWIRQVRQIGTGTVLLAALMLLLLGGLFWPVLTSLNASEPEELPAQGHGGAAGSPTHGGWILLRNGAWIRG
jgi:hypothetical protein